MSLLSSSRSLRDRGATQNNRPGFGWLRPCVLNHDGSSFPHGVPRPRFLGSICCAMARLTLDDSLSAFDLLGFPEIDRALFAAKSHFFYFGHVTFHSRVVQIPQCCHSSSQFRPPGGLGDVMLGQGWAIHAKRHPCQLSLSSTMTATS